MKKQICLGLSLLLGVFVITACAGNNVNTQGAQADTMVQAQAETTVSRESQSVVLTTASRQVDNGEAVENGQTAGSGTNILVAYFSATGTTKSLAEHAAAYLQADLYEILPEVPYTSGDLNYSSGSSRTTREQNDAAARPAIAGSVENMSQYDTVVLAYPIWHGQAPGIISTFLENYDFSGKTILPFATSHSSGIGSSARNLHSLTPDTVTWLEGKRFGAGTSQDEIAAWLWESGIKPADAQKTGVFNFDTKTVMLNSGHEMPILGLGTYSLTGETAVNSVVAELQSGGRLIDTAHIYGNEDRVGQGIRESGVPREEVFIETKLYPSQFADAENAIDEALEKLGVDYIDLMLLHHPGAGDVEAYQAMEKAISEGKIRSIGLSNWYIKELKNFLPRITIMPAVVQNEIHPYYQDSDVIDYIQSLGIVVQGWYPLGGRGHTAELLGDETISSIAEAHQVSSAQVILRWNLQKGVVVIPGSSNPDHIRENLDLFGFELTEEEMGRIAALDRNEKHDWY